MDESVFFTDHGRVRNREVWKGKEVEWKFRRFHGCSVSTGHDVDDWFISKTARGGRRENKMVVDISTHEREKSTFYHNT